MGEQPLNFQSNQPRKPLKDLRAAVIANSLRPAEEQESVKEIAERFSIKPNKVYQLLLRMRRRGQIPERQNKGMSSGKGGNKTKIASDLLEKVTSGKVPDRATRRIVLGQIIAFGANPDRKAAIIALNDMDEKDASVKISDIPVTKADAVEVLYRILSAAPPDVLEEALARRQADLIPIAAPSAEALQPEIATDHIPEDTGLPAGGGDLEGRSS